MWNIEWRRLSDRIAGLLEGGKYILETAKTGEPDHFGVTTELIRHARGVVEELGKFEARHGESLPFPARTRLREFIRYFDATFQSAMGWSGIQGTLTALASFRAEFEYLLGDTEALARSLVDRAFVHLQRSLVVDPDLRERWRIAFGAGEVACERLGAVHLLLHGVWAFKVSGEGERTDLVMGTPLTEIYWNPIKNREEPRAGAPPEKMHVFNPDTHEAVL